MAGTYDAGSVSRHDVKSTIIDVIVTPEHNDDYLDDRVEEFIIKLNGRTIKRCDRFQAKRLGIIS